MKDAPILRVLFDPDTPEHRRVREIENHYFLQAAATSTEDLVRFQSVAMAMQTRLAGELSRSQAVQYSLGVSMLDGLGAISDQLDYIGDAIHDLQDVAYESLDALYTIDATLRDGFERTAALLLEQKALLTRISDQLARPYEQQTLELRREAHKWLLRGMSGNGIDTAQDIADAQRLLTTVIDNPIGRQDYVAWFQLGWISWKSNKIPVAAESFKNAARLSEMSNDLYLVESLRHLAYMHYLDGDFNAAFDWCSRAAKSSASADVLFDLARYCWLTERRQQALETLAKAIKMKPWLYVAMLSEEDWLTEASGGEDW